MKKLIKKWLGIDTLELQVSYVSSESSVAFNRATYALTVALEQIINDAIDSGKPVKKAEKKAVKKITKTKKK